MEVELEERSLNFQTLYSNFRRINAGRLLFVSSTIVFATRSSLTGRTTAPPTAARTLRTGNSGRTVVPKPPILAVSAPDIRIDGRPVSPRSWHLFRRVSVLNRLPVRSL